MWRQTVRVLAGLIFGLRKAKFRSGQCELTKGLDAGVQVWRGGGVVAPAVVWGGG